MGLGKRDLAQLGLAAAFASDHRSDEAQIIDCSYGTALAYSDSPI